MFEYIYEMVKFLKLLCNITHVLDIRKLLELLFVHYLALYRVSIYYFVIIVCSIDFYVMKMIAEIN